MYTSFSGGSRRGVIEKILVYARLLFQLKPLIWKILDSLLSLQMTKHLNHISTERKQKLRGPSRYSSCWNTVFIRIEAPGAKTKFWEEPIYY